MKRVVIILIMCMAAEVAIGQCLNRWRFSVGELHTYDQVLSDQQYKGISFSIQGLHIGNYKKASKNVFWSFLDNFKYSSQLNRTSTAAMHYLSMKFNYGTHYAFDLGKGFRISAGGLADAYSAVKYVPRNVNNIVSADVQFGLRAALTAHYKYKVNERFAVGCHYMLSTPVIGCFFSPDYGESYYEIWRNLANTLRRDVHFSSFHNRQGINGDFDIDFVFKSGVLTVGLYHANEWWQASGNSFFISDIGGTVGFALRLASVTPY